MLEDHHREQKKEEYTIMVEEKLHAADERVRQLQRIADEHAHEDLESLESRDCEVQQPDKT